MKTKNMKSVSTLIAVTIAFSIFVAFSATASATVTTPDHYVDLSGGNTFPYDMWAKAAHSIQDAIDAADVGYTVHVAAGTYNENLIIDKAITLQAGSNPIIDGDTTGDGVPDGSCITISANGVTINGFEIRNGYNGIIGETDNSVIKNNIIHDHLNYVGSNGMGICLWGDNDNNQILNNEIYNNDRQGIFIGYFGTTKISSWNTVSGNEIYNNGLYTQPNGPDASMYGVQLWNADDNTIENNEIYGHDDWFYYPGFDFAQGIYLCAAFDNNVIGNDLHHNNYGVGAWSAGRTLTSDDNNQIHCNDIHDNTGYGVISYDVTLDATQNWWGDTSGPSEVGLGTGDAVSTNVDFDPWSFTPDPCEAKTLGFWKNHEDSVDALGYPILLGDYSVGDFEDAEDVFNNAKNKNANTMLAAQLLAAKLNVAHLTHLGIDYYDCVGEVIDDADAFLSENEYDGPDAPGSPPRREDKEEANGYKDDLDEYNQDLCIC